MEFWHGVVIGLGSVLVILIAVALFSDSSAPGGW